MNRTRFLQAVRTAMLMLGYISCLLQWLWVCIVGLPQLIKSGTLDGLFPAAPQAAPAPTIVHQTDLSPVSILAIGIMTLIFLIVTVIIFIKIPRTIAKTGEQLVHKATNAAIPVITHHKPISKKKRMELSQNLTIGLQILLVLTPLVISLVLPPVEQLTRQIIITIATTLAAASVVAFAFSWLLQPLIKATSRIR